MAAALGHARTDVATIAAMKRLIVATALVVAAVSAQAKEVLPFIEDDYSKAVARATAKNVPIFVEAWAPW